MLNLVNISVKTHQHEHKKLEQILLLLFIGEPEITHSQYCTNKQIIDTKKVQVSFACFNIASTKISLLASNNCYIPYICSCCQFLVWYSTDYICIAFGGIIWLKSKGKKIKRKLKLLCVCSLKTAGKYLENCCFLKFTKEKFTIKIPKRTVWCTKFPPIWDPDKGYIVRNLILLCKRLIPSLQP